MKTGIKYSLAFINNKESIREFFIKLSEDFITFFKGFYQHPTFFTSLNILNIIVKIPSNLPFPKRQRTISQLHYTCSDSQGNLDQNHGKDPLR